MLVQALANYADAHLSDQLEDEAWEQKPVPYLIALDANGTFLEVVSNYETTGQRNKTASMPARLAIPRSPVPRVAGLHPLLAADDVKYVLGVGPWTPRGQEQNHRERHQTFAALLREAAAVTGDDGLSAAATFYDRPDQVEKAHAAFAEVKVGTTIALALFKEPIIGRAAVRAYWSRLYARAVSLRVAKSAHAECLVSGKVGPISSTHEKIKGLASLGGQSAGVSLISFDKQAFCSYGWKQNANSPLSPDRAMAYVLALNDLLRHDSGHRRDVAGIAFVFWTKEPAGFDPISNLDRPKPEEVECLLSSALCDSDPNVFYMAGFSCIGGRMLVRCWVAKTLVSVKANLKNWFEELSVDDVFTSRPSEPPKLRQLLYAIDRNGEPPPSLVVALVCRALDGPSLPPDHRVLKAALARLRASPAQRLDPARTGLIRLCLNDEIRWRKRGERHMEQNLDLAQKHESYLCGRLLAVYESLEYSANGEVSRTVSDRYYSIASTCPGRIFPKLHDLGTKDLRKLRRSRHAAMVSIARELDQLHLEIEQVSGFRFPKALDLDGQGRFALGYHHQRAHQILQAQASNRANKGQYPSEEKN
jgi:CRISPR-associated protein Csd1